MTKKLTKMEMFKRIKEHLTDKNEIAFINHEIELLESKKAGIKKPTATQQENEIFKIEITTFMEDNFGEMFTIVDLQNKIPTLKDLSNQRISALLKQLVDNHKITKVYEKRKAYFFIG